MVTIIIIKMITASGESKGIKLSGASGGSSRVVSKPVSEK